MTPVRLPFLLLSSALLLAPSAALAQGSAALSPAEGPQPETTPPPPANDSPPRTEPTPTPSEERHGEPKNESHSGFVASLSIGYALPSGDATGAPNDALGSTFSGEVPLSIEIGGNVTPSFFVGAYGTFAPGGMSGDVANTCNTDQLNCSANSVRAGLALRYRFLPGEVAEPWIGYAVGYETTSFSISSSQSSLQAGGNLRGWEYGHFSLGVDFLAAPQLAVGPFIDVSAGQYGHMYLQPATPNQPTIDSDIPNTGIHEWVTLGVRAVIMP
jgi:hypothetical protein